MALSVDRPFEQHFSGVTNGSATDGFNPTSASSEVAELNEISASGRVELQLRVDTNKDGTVDQTVTIEDVHPAADDIGNGVDRSIRADKRLLANPNDSTASHEWRFNNTSGDTLFVQANGFVLG